MPVSGEASTNTQSPVAPPLIFGEVLFDSFPDGSTVLGGAPFNVAWHLAGFSAHPLFISSVGQDDGGNQVVSAMHRWGMETTGVQLSDQYPTGRVDVSFADGQPSFDIVENQAYDFIDAKRVEATVNTVGTSLIYFGTLAIRNQVSANALRYLLGLGGPAFVDINLRAPWWNKASIDAALCSARWAKLNDDELAVVSNFDAQNYKQLLEAGRALRKKYDLEYLIVTRGAQGVVVVSEQKEITAEPPVVTEVVDTVGAGDAFSSVFVFGILNAWPIEDTIKRALQFAAKVCTLRGATTQDRSIYQKLISEWNQQDYTSS